MPSAEIISIGGELLTGATLNTNAKFISEKLEGIGFHINRQTTIGDDHDLILETLSESLACCPLVIATGGLGPAAASELFESPLEYNEENQVTVPKKAMILPNKLGTAPGLVLHNGQSTLILLPGVPPEMEALMIEEVIPFLQKTFTLPEREEQELNRESSDGSIESAIQELFLKKKLTLSLAESCSGGDLSSRLVHKAGASEYFVGSVVAYSNELKEKILGVPKETIETYGAVSKETALAMAEGILALTGSDFAISVTGIAGPSGGSAEKPVGTIFIGIKKKGSPALYKHIHAVSGSRAMIIERAGHIAFGELYRSLVENS